MKTHVISLGASFALCILMSCSGEESRDGKATLSYESGGEVSIVNPRSPIFGAKVVIAPKTLSASEETIEIKFEDTLPGPFNAEAQALGARQASKVLIVSRTGDMDLSLPAAVTLPYDKSIISDRGVPVVLQWDPEKRSYGAAAITSIDYDKGAVTFKLAHFTQKMVVATLKSITNAVTGLSDTGFRSDVDGFFVFNFGAYDSPGGSCLGMANYAGWYFDTKKASQGKGLYSLYLEGDPAKVEDDQNVRELISRAFMMSSQYWAQTALTAQVMTGEVFTGLYLLSTLILTKSPQTLIMADATPIQSFGHAAVVYGYDASRQAFLIYDNNFPGEEVTLKWTLEDGFGTYSKNYAYNNQARKFAFDSLHSSFSPKTFETLFQGVENGWASSKFPKITLSQPSKQTSTPNFFEVASADNVTITGNVPRASAEQNPNAQRYAHIYLDGVNKVAAVPVSAAGDFNYSIKTLPNPAGTDVMILVSEDAVRFFNGFRSFKQFRIRAEGQSFFKNLGFETGGFDFWNSERHIWGGGAVVIPSDKSGIVANGFDPIATDLPVVRLGSFAARVNNFDPDGHISTVSQMAVVPAVANPTLRFHWSAVLEDPSHAPFEQPYVEVSVLDQTLGTTLYKQRYYSNDPGYSGWRSYDNGTWKAIPWQVAELGVKANVGSTLLIQVEAADCLLGAHGGYVYLDGEE